MLGTLADTKLVQDHLFQANYFRDPTKLGTREYKANSQLAQWNGEGDHSNSSASRHNWLRTQSLCGCVVPRTRWCGQAKVSSGAR